MGVGVAGGALRHKQRCLCLLQLPPGLLLCRAQLFCSAATTCRPALSAGTAWRSVLLLGGCTLGLGEWARGGGGLDGSSPTRWLAASGHWAPPRCCCCCCGGGHPPLLPMGCTAIPAIQVPTTTHWGSRAWRHHPQPTAAWRTQLHCAAKAHCRDLCHGCARCAGPGGGKGAPRQGQWGQGVREDAGLLIQGVRGGCRQQEGKVAKAAIRGGLKAMALRSCQLLIHAAAGAASCASRVGAGAAQGGACSSRALLSCSSCCSGANLGGRAARPCCLLGTGSGIHCWLF